MSPDGTFVVDLPVVNLGAGETVLAALALLPHDIEVLICLSGVERPVDIQVRLVRGLCDRLLGEQRQAAISVVGHAAAMRRPAAFT